MQLLSDISRDARHEKKKPGSYEWWYFDGISEDGKYQLVIIFYDGCPFSTQYVRNMELDPESDRALSSGYPAISISLYQKGVPIFYCLSQYPPGQCSFNDHSPAVTVGENTMSYTERESYGSMTGGSFDLRINERLPSGDEIKGIITFSGMSPNERLFAGQGSTSDDHIWNLIFPRSSMQCRVNVMKNGLIVKDLIFSGTGYHDHNVGSEPMKESFRDWYWGRVHFPQATLVYYVMNKKSGQNCRAWLLSPDNRRLLHTLELVDMSRRRFNGFLLRSARKLHLKDNETEIEVHHHTLMDSGPFYCRYLSGAALKHPALGTETAEGIAEYIRPQRIHRRIFWPLVHMRIRYADQKPHWVQKSARLYRWTW